MRNQVANINNVSLAPRGHASSFILVFFGLKMQPHFLSDSVVGTRLVAHTLYTEDEGK